MWAKQLTVIGIGFNPQKQNPRLTKVYSTSSTATSVSISTAGSGSKFYGILFTGYDANYNSVVFSQSVSNLVFENCHFNSVCGFNNQIVSNILFQNCVFDGNNGWNIFCSASGSANSSIVANNCIFDGAIHGGANPALQLTVDHCLFLRTDNGPLVEVSNAVVKNSIFMNHANIHIGSNSFNNAYQHCISRLGSFPANPGNLNNQNSTNPLLTTYTPGQHHSTANNYALQAGSPGLAAGNDATDIGLHGGSSGFHETGEVQIVPIIRALNITTTTVAPNGSMNVQIHATSPND